MNVPSLGWLQGPWSPAGYAVVELEEDAPDDGPPDREEIPEAPRSPLGYRVVELTPSPAPKARPQPTKPACAEKKRPPPRRPWTTLAAGGSCLSLLALVLALAVLSARARSVLLAKVPAQKVKLATATAAHEEVWPADRQGADRQTFGTAVEFVRNAQEAGRIADEQHRLTCVLHVSGNFEDTGFT